MLKYLRRKAREKTLSKNALPDALWESTCGCLPFLAHWTSDMRTALRAQSTLFLVEKNIFSGHESLIVTPEMRTLIAAQACTLILHRTLDDYAGWTNIVVHPDSFPRTQDEIDDAGIVHHDAELVAGEAWEDGPVLLSWPDVWASRDFDHSGMNLVIHEFAHKIDMRAGEANGVPALKSRALHDAWCSALQAAFEDFRKRVDLGEETEIDPYASEHESEFFAVCAEIYVAAPEILKKNYPEFFKEMNAFFLIWESE